MKNSFVFDTNALISAALSPFSINAEALNRAEGIGKIVYSNATWTEFLAVLFRSKFDSYFTIGEREEIADRFLLRFKKIKVTETVTACRDPDDNRFLELALSSNANCIVTGDADLLVLHLFRGIPILKAADFLKNF